MVVTIEKEDMIKSTYFSSVIVHKLTWDDMAGGGIWRRRDAACLGKRAEFAWARFLGLDVDQIDWKLGEHDGGVDLRFGERTISVKSTKYMWGAMLLPNHQSGLDADYYCLATSVQGGKADRIRLVGWLPKAELDEHLFEHKTGCMGVKQDNLRPPRSLKRVVDIELERKGEAWTEESK